MQFDTQTQEAEAPSPQSTRRPSQSPRPVELPIAGDYYPPFAPPFIELDSLDNYESSTATSFTASSPTFVARQNNSILLTFHSEEQPHRIMNHLAVRASDYGSVKTRAVEEAKAMQIHVVETANKTGMSPPKYILLELIGKGSFGRVFKA